MRDEVRIVTAKHDHKASLVACELERIEDNRILAGLPPVEDRALCWIDWRCLEEEGRFVYATTRRYPPLEVPVLRGPRHNEDGSISVEVKHSTTVATIKVSQTDRDPGDTINYGRGVFAPGRRNSP